MARDGTETASPTIGLKDGYVLRAMPENKFDTGPDAGFGDDYIYIKHQMYRVEKPKWTNFEDPKKIEGQEKAIQPMGVYDKTDEWDFRSPNIDPPTFDRFETRHPDGTISSGIKPRDMGTQVSKDAESLLSLFDEAMRDGSVTHERGEDYGHPFDDFSRSVQIKDALKDCPLPVLRHVLEMIGVKMARAVNDPYKLDTWIDIAGYARCAVMILEKLK